MFRLLGIFIVAGVLISAGADRWREACRCDGATAAISAETPSLLLEDSEAAAVDAGAGVDEATGLDFANPPTYGLCHVHNVTLQECWSTDIVRATVGAPAKVRAAKFPNAPFRLIEKRVLVYGRPRHVGICGTGRLDQARELDCPVCVAAQKEWFRNHPAPEQVVVKIPGEEPSAR